MFLLIGNIFLRGLLVKHAKYISIESNSNTLMVSDFGLPVWLSIISFSFLHILYFCLTPDFPYNFPNVRICQNLSSYTNVTELTGHDNVLHNKMFISMMVGWLLLMAFVISAHLKIYSLQRSFTRQRQVLRQNVNTVQQVLAAAYIKLACSLLILRYKILSYNVCR